MNIVRKTTEHNVMNNILVEKRVLRYVKKKLKSKSFNFYKDLLENYSNIAIANDITIIFTKSSLFFPTASTLNANAAKKNYIFVSPGWAYQLIKNDNFETKTAFLATIGHELTHQNGQLSLLKTFKYGIYATRFLAKTNEVRCDFGAAQKMLESNREKLVISMNFKKKFSQKDKGDFCHPPWSKRIEYVTNYNFDENLIRKIAQDLNYKNEKIIKKVCDYYENILLT